jgi:nitroreductase
MKAVLDMTAEYLRRSLKLLDSRFLKAMARFLASAKAGVAVAPDLRMRINEYSDGRDAITYHAPAAMFFHAPANSSTPQTDCDTALFSVQLYAEAFGLGSCWNGLIQMAAAGAHLRGFTRLAEFLRVPQGHKCYAAMTLGYPSANLHSLPERQVDLTWIDRD